MMVAPQISNHQEAYLPPMRSLASGSLTQLQFGNLLELDGGIGAKFWLFIQLYKSMHKKFVLTDRGGVLDEDE